MTHHRHRGNQESSGAVIALGALLVLMAAGVLYGAYRWVKRKQPPPAAAAAADEVGLVQEETPFDNALIAPDTGAFVMVVEVPTRPDEAAEARLVRAVEACLSFRDEARLYPEADGRERVVRVLFHFRPAAPLLERLPRARVDVWVYGADQKPRPLREADVRPAPAPEPETETGKPLPVTIDLVLENPATGALALVLVQDAPWTAATIAAVGRKVAGYLETVASGALAPQLADGQSVEIHVHCRHRPGPEALAGLRRLRDALGDEGIAFLVLLVGAGPEEELDLDR